MFKILHSYQKIEENALTNLRNVVVYIKISGFLCRSKKMTVPQALNSQSCCKIGQFV